jgi:hypothetical protein
MYFIPPSTNKQMNSTGYKKPIISRRPSIQGEWHERMDLIGLKVDIENVFPSETTTK